MRSNGENIAKETSNKLSENRKSFGHLCKKSPHASPGYEKQPWENSGAALQSP